MSYNQNVPFVNGLQLVDKLKGKGLEMEVSAQMIQVVGDIIIVWLQLHVFAACTIQPETIAVLQMNKKWSGDRPSKV